MNFRTKQLKNATCAALLAAWMLPVVSCSGDSEADDSVLDGNPVEARFSAQISGLATRASGTTWDKDDEVGIFMLVDAGSISNTADIKADNYPYKVNSTSAVSDAASYLNPVAVADGGKGAIFMDSGTAFDFVAYYPYKADTDLTGYEYPIDLAVQHGTKSSSDHDLLYAKSRRNNIRTEDVSFEFSHVLSNLIINVVRGDGVDATDFAAKNVVIKGMPTTANLELADGKTLNGVGTVADIESSKSDTDGEKYEVIILPQTTGTGRTISFTVSGVDYFWSIPNGFAFEQGKRYTYNFTLSTGGLELEGDVVVGDWIDGGELDPTDTGWGSGSAELLQFETVPITPTTFKIGLGSASPTIAHDVSFAGTVIPKMTKMSKYQITTTQYCHYLNGNRDNITVIANASEYDAYGKMPAVGLYGETTNFVLAADVTTGSTPAGVPAGLVLLVRSHAWSISYDAAKDIWSPKAGYENHPINCVTWYGAYAFCEWAGGGCRLPTEAEWEFACRAGSTETVTATSCYGMGVTSASNSTPVQITETTLVNYAYYNNNDGAYTKAVGLKLPNVWGLYDMHGNVWEWCYDWYDAAYYTATTVTDPVNLTYIANRVLRGGYFSNAAPALRSAYRGPYAPASVYSNVGFRVVFPL